MPELGNTTRWLRHEPDIFGNRECERPFYFEVAASLSKEQRQSVADAIRKRSDVPALKPEPTEDELAAYKEAERVERVDRYAKALEPHLRFGGEALTVNGTPIKTVREYLDLVSSKLAPLDAFTEMSQVLFEVNTLGTRSGFFSGRPFGGSASTTR